MTHHVELVLPGAHYLVRMLDGRIDTQGTVKDLRVQGMLEGIEHDAAVETFKEEIKEAAEEVAVDQVDPSKPTDAIKKPRKLIKDEHRETGGVKWSIYNSYLKASCVTLAFNIGFYQLTVDISRSYWTWIFLALLIVVSQCLGISEKLWIKVHTRALLLCDHKLTSYPVDLGRSLQSSKRD